MSESFFFVFFVFFNFFWAQAVSAQVISSHGKSPELQLGKSQPGVVLVVGVNGGGKTTTIGKLAHKLTAQGAKVITAVPGGVLNWNMYHTSATPCLTFMPWFHSGCCLPTGSQTL